jgi:hypothetical protein
MGTVSDKQVLGLQLRVACLFARFAPVAKRSTPVSPEGLYVDRDAVKLVFAETTQSQQDLLYTTMGLRVPIDGTKPTPFNAEGGGPPGNSKRIKRLLWDGATPVWYFATSMFTDSWILSFFKDGVKYAPDGDTPSPAGYGNNIDYAAIAPDGTHYAFGRNVFAYEPDLHRWAMRYCTPLPGASRRTYW